MPLSPKTIRSCNRGALLLGLLCILLVVFGATLQVLHTHDLDGSSHSDCAFCLVAHATPAPQAPLELPLAVEQTAYFEAAPAQTPLDTALFFFYSRPPPAESVSL